MSSESGSAQTAGPNPAVVNGWMMKQPDPYASPLEQQAMKGGMRAGPGAVAENYTKGVGDDSFSSSDQCTPLSMLPGERSVFQATEARFCHCVGARVNPEDAAHDKDMHNHSGLMLTNKRIVYHWVNKMCCLPSTKAEESFPYSDVQFAWLRRGFSYFFLFAGILLFIGGVVAIAVAGMKDPGTGKKTKPVPEVIIAGVAGIIVGVVMIVIWVIQLYSSGIWLNISYSRASPVSISDWSTCCMWGPPRTHRAIQLPVADAHMAYYTLLSHPLVYNNKMPHNDLKYL